MKNREFYKYLDHPTQLPEDAEQRALAEILEETGELEIFEPEQDYWNQFNSRLQMRLQEQEPKRGFNWRAWFLCGAAGFVAAATVLFAVLPNTAVTKDLTRLDDESLAFLSEVYSDFADEDPAYSLAENDGDLLLETYEFEDDNLLPTGEDWSPVDVDSLKALWKEG